MATREELMAFLSNYLTSQATDPSWYYTSSPAELETVYKDYIKSQYDLGTSYDTVINKYRVLDQSDPVVQDMFSFFNRIANKQATAADILNQYEDLLTPGQIQDLRTYEDEMYAREKTIQEIDLEKRANAEIYGLPMPDASAYIPPLEMLQGFEPVQKGGMTELATNQRWLRDAQKKYAEAQASSKVLTQGPMLEEVQKTDPGYKKNFTSALWNDTLGKVFGEVDREPISKPKRQPSTKAIQDRNTAYTTKRAAELRVQQDSTFTERLAGEIAKQMVQKYGTPYDAALKKARELAEEEARKKAEGRGN